MVDKTTPIAGPTPPLDHPAVVIGGRTLTLKYSLLADYVLDRRGIDTKGIIPTLRSDKPGRNSLIIELFAACVAHNFVEAGEPVPTPEQWCLRLTIEQLRELGGNLVRALFPNLPASAALGAETDGAGTTAAPPVQ
jgi:hypothetical protein